MKPRVVHVVPGFDPTGAAEQAAWLQQALSASIDTHIVVWGQPRVVAPLPDMPPQTVLLPRRSGCDAFAFRQLSAYLRSLGRSVVHSWLSIHDAWGQAGLAGLAPRRRIVTWRESLPRVSWWSRRVLQSASHVIAPTAQLSAQAIEVSSSRLIATTIPDAVTVSATIAKPESTGFTKTIVAWGRYSYADHWQDAIWAADILRVVQPGRFQLHLISQGEQTDELRRFIQQVEIQDTVQLHPWSEWPTRLAQADVIWSLNSTVDLPRALLTAIAQRVPVVACRTPTLATWIEHDQTGRVIQSGDRADLARQTLWLTDHPERAEHLELAAQRRLQAQHAPQQIAASYEQLYHELAR